MSQDPTTIRGPVGPKGPSRKKYNFEIEIVMFHDEEAPDADDVAYNVLTKLADKYKDFWFYISDNENKKMYSKVESSYHSNEEWKHFQIREEQSRLLKEEE